MKLLEEKKLLFRTHGSASPVNPHTADINIHIKERINSDAKRRIAHTAIRLLDHQVDPVLMAQIGEAFAAHFKGRGITKVVTIESSGIAPALMTASALGVPMVILKKQPSQILNDNLYQTVITSFTKETNYELTLSKKYISEEDHVLIVDDFLANGEAATGAIRLLRLAHATIAGLGVLVEKSFQPGREKLVDQGTEVYALARVGAMDTDHVEFLPADDE